MKVKIIQGVRFEGVKALAAETGYSKTQISRVLHGKLIPKAELAKKLRLLGVKYPVAK